MKKAKQVTNQLEKDNRRRYEAKQKHTANLQKGAKQPPVSAAKFCLDWQRLTFNQKCLYLGLMLLASGVSARYIYNVVIGMVYSVDLHVESHTRQNNKLSKDQIREFRTKQFDDTKVKLDPQIKWNKAYQSQVKSFEHDVRRTVKTAVSTNIYQNVVMQKDFSVVITDKHRIENSPASFSSSTNTVFFAVEPLSTKQDIANQLKNEMHHASLFWHNRNRGCIKPADVRYLSEPFCDSQGFNKDQAQQLVNSIDSANNTIENFYRTWIKNPNSPLITQQIEAISSQPPVSMIINVPRNHFQKEIDSALFQLKKKKNDEHVYLRSRDDQIISDIYYTVLGVDGQQLIVRQSFGSDDSQESLIRGFVGYWRYLKDLTLSNNQSLYAMKKLSTYSRYAELASNIDEFSDNIKQTLFSEYCHFFADYFQVDQFCGQKI